jgi:hypothetical protein
MIYSTPVPEPIPFEKIDTDKVELGNRFIHRIEKFGCYYVQIRGMVNGKMYYGRAKTFYDNKYATSKDQGRQKALEAAIRFREEHVWEFFRAINYDPTLRVRKRDRAQRERERPKKFRIRKEADSGIMSNLRYIRLIKRKNQYVRCILEVTVNVHGRHFASKAYSYSFDKYGGKVEALKIAKKDRDRLSALVHKKAELLNQKPPLSKTETRDEIKSIRIKKTFPQNDFEPGNYMRRSFDNRYWIVKIEKRINHFYFRVPNKRFYDAEYEDKKFKSQMAARRYVINIMTGLNKTADEIKKARITDHYYIEQLFKKVLDENVQSEKNKPSDSFHSCSKDKLNIRKAS